MSTTDSFRELILQDIITVLKTIKTANGYRTNVLDENIGRTLKDSSEMDYSEFPALFVSDGFESLTPLTNREIEADLRIIITGYVRFNPDAEVAEIASQQLNKLIADTKEVIMDTTKVLWTNNNAGLTRIVNVDTDEGILEPDAVFRMEIVCQYQFIFDNAGRSVAV